MGTQYALADVGLFAEEEALPAPPPLPDLVYPHNLFAEQDTAPNTHTLLDWWEGWRAERADRPYDPADLAWHPTTCGPTYTQDDLAGDVCKPLILTVDLRCDHHRVTCACVGGLIYRHACTCGLLAPACEDENGAVEDAMDHAWSGWRDLPVHTTWRHDGPPAKQANATEKWLTAALQAGYPSGWLEAGGPVRTRRIAGGHRHVPGRTPWDGYDLAAPTVDDTELPPDLAGLIERGRHNARKQARQQTT